MLEHEKAKLFEALEQVSVQNLLSLEEVNAMIEEVVKKAFASKFDPDAELELIIDKDSKKFELINHTKYVVEDEEYTPEYRAIEIPLSEAKKIKADVAVGDTVSEVVDFALYSKVIAQQIRQMFTQTVKEKKKEAIYAKHQSLKGEMITVTVSIIADKYSIFTLEDGTVAYMPANLRNPNIKLAVGQKTQVFVEDVLKESKDAQIVVSNGSKQVVKRVLEAEVPEIADGTVEIVAISRIPGLRSKVAVRTSNPNVDPVGAIIGAQGQRINQIVEKLQGEKLDIIPWSADENTFAAHALLPARIVAVVDKKDANGEVIPGTKVAIAPNKHQTLAIGKSGSNVRLAVELTNLRIDVMSVDQAREREFDWTFNVGLTERDLQSIESGERVGKKSPSSSFVPRQTSFAPTTKIDSNIFDDSIESFTNQIEEHKSTETVEDLKIDENLFTEEQLRQMEADFEFDEELSDFEYDDEFAEEANEE